MDIRWEMTTSLAATDLRHERDAARQRGEAAQIARIYVPGSAEAAEVLYLPDSGRIGIAWGSDADWADAEGLEEGILRWQTEDAAAEEAVAEAERLVDLGGQ